MEKRERAINYVITDQYFLLLHRRHVCGITDKDIILMNNKENITEIYYVSFLDLETNIRISCHFNFIIAFCHQILGLVVLKLH